MTANRNHFGMPSLIRKGRDSGKLWSPVMPRPNAYPKPHQSDREKARRLRHMVK
jgi:hypothetical protein